MEDLHNIPDETTAWLFIVLIFLFGVWIGTSICLHITLSDDTKKEEKK